MSDLPRPSAQASLPDETTHFSKSTGTIKMPCFECYKKVTCGGQEEKTVCCIREGQNIHIFLL